MAQSVRDLPGLFRTPIGRIRLGIAVVRRAWPLLAPLAALHRRTLARRTRVVAVTGSFGKTTTARAIEAALGLPVVTSGHNAGGFVAWAVLRIRPARRHAVVEVGLFERGDLERYAGLLRPDVAVVTAVGSEHQRSLGDLEAVREEKSRIVRAIGATGHVVLNGDDPNVLWMRSLARGRVATFGFADDNDVRASAVTLDWPQGTRFTLSTREGAREVFTRLIGRPGVYAVLAAVTVALEEGIPLDRALAGLGDLGPTRSRLEPVRLAGGAILLRDEHKSGEATIDVALDVLADIPATRRIVVLGELTDPIGSRRAVCRRLGERVARIASGAIFVTEIGAAPYRIGAARGGLPAERVLDAGPSVRTATEALRRDLRAGDVVLIKGRGSQRLDRVSLALMGRDVRCELAFCDVKIACDRCPMLERRS